MDNERQLIDHLTAEFYETYGADKACAIISSVLCQLYQLTDMDNAMVLAQPDTGILVITTTMDASEQIPTIVAKTLEQLPKIIEQINQDDKKDGKDTIKYIDGDAQEIVDKPNEKVPPNSKLH